MSWPGQYNELREKMAVVKNLYCSRHYTQCAKLGELLLSEAHDETHPLHLAHLNFYTALSHDTLAREATLKNRRKELVQAEKHYLAAINVLSSTQPLSQEPQKAPIPEPQQEPQQQPQQNSPDSAFSDLVFPWHRRGSCDSLGSRRSGASSATSLFFEELDSTYETGQKELSFPLPPRAADALSPAKTPRRHDSATALYLHPTTPAQYQFSANVAQFVRMLERHLADVRGLRDRASVPTVHFTAPSPQTSPRSAEFTLCSRDSSPVTETSMETKRQRRRTVVFRPRFDPESVRALCREAMAELAE